MPQLPFSLGPDGICGCLLEDQFAVWKILVVQWQILQFIPEHPHVFFLVMMDGIQCGCVTLLFENLVSNLDLVNQCLVG